MTTIYKFRLGQGVSNALSMPTGAELLHVGEQMGELYLWARVDTSRVYENRELVVAGTGWLEGTPARGQHIGSVQMSSGLVWHVFEPTPPKVPGWAVQS